METPPPPFSPAQAADIVAAAAPYVANLSQALRLADDDTIVTLAQLITEVTGEVEPTVIGGLLLHNTDLVVAIGDGLRNLSPDLPSESSRKRVTWRVLNAMMWSPHLNRANVLLATVIGGLMVIPLLLFFAKPDSFVAGFLVGLGGSFLQLFMLVFQNTFGGSITASLGFGKPGTPSLQGDFTLAAGKKPPT